MAAGKVMHPLVQRERLLDHDAPRGGTSDVGYLDPQVLAALAPLLGDATTTPDDTSAAYWVGGTGRDLIGRSWTTRRPSRCTRVRAGSSAGRRTSIRC